MRALTLLTTSLLVMAPASPGWAYIWDKDMVDQPSEKAQESIIQKLNVLQRNLEEQERGLRQHVETIPSHIHAKIRSEKSRIRKLNNQLESV